MGATNSSQRKRLKGCPLNGTSPLNDPTKTTANSTIDPVGNVNNNSNDAARRGTTTMNENLKKNAIQNISPTVNGITTIVPNGHAAKDGNQLIGTSASRLKADAFGSIDELHKYRISSRTNSPRTVPKTAAILNSSATSPTPKPYALPPQTIGSPPSLSASSASPTGSGLVKDDAAAAAVGNNKRMRSLPEHRVRIKSAGIDIVIKEFHLGIDPGPIQVDETSGSIFKFKTPYFRGRAILEIPPIDVAETWIFGWIQACYDLKFINTYGKYGYSQWMIPGLNGSLERAVSDSDGKRFPWYGLCTELFVVEGPTFKTVKETVAMSDNFYPCVTWDIPTDKYESAKLTKVSRDQKFYVWLVGMNATKRQIYVLKGAKWGMKVTVKLDPARPLGSRTKSVSGRLDPPVILDKDRRIPDNAMVPPSANSCQKLVWKPRGKREKIVIPAKRQMHHNERKLKEQIRNQQSEVTRRMTNVILQRGLAIGDIIKGGSKRASFKALSIDNSHLTDSIPSNPPQTSQQSPMNLESAPLSSSTEPVSSAVRLLGWKKDEPATSSAEGNRTSTSSLTNADKNGGGTVITGGGSLGNVSTSSSGKGRRLSRVLVKSLLDLDGLPVEHIREVDESITRDIMNNESHSFTKDIPLPRCASNARSYSCEIEEEYLDTPLSEEGTNDGATGIPCGDLVNGFDNNCNNTSNNDNLRNYRKYYE